MKTLRFNFTEGQHQITNGNPTVLTDYTEVNEQWFEQFIQIERGIYPIYDDKYGTNKWGMLQYRLPAAAQLSEINRQVQDAKDINTNIESITTLELDSDNNIVATLTLKAES